MIDVLEQDQSHDLVNQSAGLLRQQAMVALSESKWPMAEELLALGMTKYPDVLDVHGDPTFCKELIRHLVKQRRWAAAEALIPSETSAHLSGWYHILFARALDASGNQKEAQSHWKEFLKTRPRHQEALAALAGLSIDNYESQFSSLPSPLGQIKREVPGQKFEMILDVGANEGQSCIPYATAFPGALIYAFEPVPATFVSLVKNLEAIGNVFPVNVALSSTAGTVDMSTSGTSTMNRVSKTQDQASTTRIPSMTLDQFCFENHITHVDFLKIDTEGFDLDVLKGCGDFIRNVDFIQCEASANVYNRYHVSFASIFEYLSERGFYLFFIDGATYEWANGGYPILRRFDPVFINATVVGELKGVIDR